MNGDAVLDLLMGRLGSRTNTTLRATCLLEMAGVQDKLERTGLSFKPWFLFTDDQTLVTVADTETVSLPSGFLGFQDEWDCVFYWDTSRTTVDKWKRLVRKPYGDMKLQYYDEGTGAPKHFDEINKTLYLRYIPDAVYTLRVLYYGRDDPPTDAAAENKWLENAWELLLAETGNIVSTKHLRDAEIASIFAADVTVARAELRREHERRLHELMDYNMGDD